MSDCEKSLENAAAIRTLKRRVKHLTAWLCILAVIVVVMCVVIGSLTALVSDLADLVVQLSFYHTTQTTTGASLYL